MISLENLCLNLIVKNFERFYFAFNVSRDKDLNRNFEFLQRKYSFELASELYKKENFKDEYMKFYMNKHLKVFDEKWLWNSYYVIFMEDILRCLPNLTKIVSFSRCCDEDVKNIAKFCPKIVEINISNSNVTDYGIAHLCKDENEKLPCPELKNIFITGTNITDDGVEHLIKNLPSLQMIDYERVPLLLYYLHADDNPQLETEQRYNLVHLDFFPVKNLKNYDNILKTCLSVCSKLKSIACCIFDKDQLNFFRDTNLEELCIEFFNSKINISDFLKINGHHLVSLKILDCTMSIFDLVINCPNLKELFLSNVIFSDDNNDCHLVFNCLTKCSFQIFKDDRSSEKAMHFILSSSPKLESLMFRYCALSVDMKIHILKSCKMLLLKDITLVNYQIEFNFIKDILLSCPVLRKLSLFCRFENQDIKNLYELVKTLPNKPHLDYQWDFTGNLDSDPDSDLEADGFYSYIYVY